MSDITSLEARLRASPDDWPSWLAYADCLDGQRDIRGALVRFGHRIATEPLSVDQRRTLVRQSRALERQHQAVWGEGLPEGLDLQWRFGFVVGVEMYWNADLLDELVALRAHPNARLFAKLGIEDYDLDDSAVDSLVRAGALSGLHTLRLAEGRITDEGAAVLARAPGLDSLVSLSLESNSIEEAGAAALARADGRALASLDLTANNVGSGIVALAQSTALGALERLLLGGNGIEDDWIVSFAQQCVLGSLVRLDLSDNLISDIGAAALAQSTALDNLRELALDGNDLDDEGVIVFAHSCTLPALASLDLRFNAFGSDGRTALSRSKLLRGCTVRL